MRQQGHHDLIETFRVLLIRHKKKAKTAWIILFVLFSALLIGGSFVPAHSDEDQMWKTVILSVFGIFLMILIFHTSKESKKYGPDDSPIIEAIKYHNRDGNFTWVYPYTHIYNGVASYYLMFMTHDKKRFQLILKGEHEYELINDLALIMPNATFGFSEDLKRQYKKDPKSLLQHR